MLLVLFTPLPFVDVTASWRFPSKWQRIATAAAGVYFELFVAALAIILWNWSDDSVVRHAALNVAATAGVASLLINGNPLMRFDGYYILSDWLELPNLSGSGQKYIASLFQRIVGIERPPDNRSPRTRRIVAVYAVASLVWRNMVYAGLLLVLYAMVSKLGAFVADAALVLAVAAILLNPVRNAVRFLRKQQTLSMKRLWIVAAGALGCVASGGLPPDPPQHGPHLRHRRVLAADHRALRQSRLRARSESPRRRNRPGRPGHRGARKRRTARGTGEHPQPDRAVAAPAANPPPERGNRQGASRSRQVPIAAKEGSAKSSIRSRG